jgi:hypothetical protein
MIPSLPLHYQPFFLQQINEWKRVLSTEYDSVRDLKQSVIRIQETSQSPAPLPLLPDLNEYKIRLRKVLTDSKTAFKINSMLSSSFSFNGLCSTIILLYEQNNTSTNMIHIINELRKDYIKLELVQRLYPEMNAIPQIIQLFSIVPYDTQGKKRRTIRKRHNRKRHSRR